MNQKSENLISEIIQNRRLIKTLAKNDFKTKFSGSYLGTVWAFVQPVITVLIYWFVFDMAIGARAQIRGELPLPYVLWLVAGIVPWFFFSDCLSAGTSVLNEYNYLVKKVVFHIDILPVVKIFSSIFVHVFFVAVAVLLFLLYGYFPDLYVLQALYYSAGVLLLALGMSYFTSAVSVFFPDVRQIVNIGLQIGVWATPIMWDINDMKEKIPEAVLIIMKCNPLYYIVLGYREAFIDKVWFWEHPGMTLYFWGFTLTVCLLGVKVFKRLKVHFADVL
ncbi:MAG: ABC transporter permease [Lachnospiraceae bacterium]|jgi:teichoic acid transport system permease protein|nr:ABC transporter permease [Lachnospiraceae bacterium]MCI9058895.1 ABC transporter permease [Lachnospiraceae bacterium]